MCSHCAGDYENPDVTAPGDGEDSPMGLENSPGPKIERRCGGVACAVQEALEEIAAAVRQLERLEQWQQQLLREAVRVTQHAAEVIGMGLPEAAAAHPERSLRGAHRGQISPGEECNVARRDG